MIIEICLENKDTGGLYLRDICYPVSFKLSYDTRKAVLYYPDGKEELTISNFMEDEGCIKIIL